MSEKFKKELIEWIKVIATALVFAFYNNSVYKTYFS